MKRRQQVIEYINDHVPVYLITTFKEELVNWDQSTRLNTYLEVDILQMVHNQADKTFQEELER
jgi:hypothetical protein